MQGFKNSVGEKERRRRVGDRKQADILSWFMSAHRLILFIESLPSEKSKDDALD